MDTFKKGQEIWSAEVMVVCSLLLTQVQNCAWFTTFCSKKKNSLLHISRLCIVYRQLSAVNSNCRPFKTSVLSCICIHLCSINIKNFSRKVKPSTSSVLGWSRNWWETGSCWPSGEVFFIMYNYEIYCYFLAVGHVLFISRNQTARAGKN